MIYNKVASVSFKFKITNLLIPISLAQYLLNQALSKNWRTFLHLNYFLCI